MLQAQSAYNISVLSPILRVAQATPAPLAKLGFPFFESKEIQST
jgi:hypothetical protein